MDFSFTPEQEALRELARTILNDHATPERLKALETSGEWFDHSAWAELAKARLLGVAVPEDLGGSGLGLIELGLLLEEVGRAVAPTPALATLVLGVLPVLQFGTAVQQRRLLHGVLSGETVLTAALIELAEGNPNQPATTARKDGPVWRLDGVKVCVPAGTIATRIIVPATTGDGASGLFVLDPHATGVQIERQVLTNGEPHARLTLSGAIVPATDMLGDPTGGGTAIRWLTERALVGYCAMQLGVCDRALRLTAEYTTGREQFGRPIATFQAVQQRAADAYINLEAIRLTTWEALYRLAAGLPSEEQVTVAKFWAAEAGQYVTVAAQHLHGGIGVDVDYPLHRYFLWGKHIELMLGSATPHLAAIGAQLAAHTATSD